MKSKNKIIFGAVGIIVLLILIVIIRSPEDDWIKDKRGVYVKHGYPLKTPDYVLEQQELINKSLQLYNQEKSSGAEFSSQCLGVVGDYAVDIVHVPRTEEDNLPENQCSDYNEGGVSHFIELSSDGEIVRVV